jgi:hypothetical protein
MLSPLSYGGKQGTETTRSCRSPHSTALVSVGKAGRSRRSLVWTGTKIYLLGPHCSARNIRTAPAGQTTTDSARCGPERAMAAGYRSSTGRTRQPCSGSVKGER